MATLMPFGALYVVKETRKRGRGRPSLREKMMTEDQDEQDIINNALDEADIERRISNSKLVKNIRSNPNNTKIADMLLEEFAKEAASLEIDRIRLQADGKDTSGVAQKRLTALRLTMDGYYRKIDMMKGGALDLKHPDVARLIEYLIHVFMQAMSDTKVPHDMITVVMDKLTHVLEDETRMRAFIQGKK
jgi:hypothetical protein